MDLEGKINLSFVPFGCGGGHSLSPSLVATVGAQQLWALSGGEDDRERGNTVVMKQVKRRMSNKQKISWYNTSSGGSKTKEK